MQRNAFQNSLRDKQAEGLYLLYGSEQYLLDYVKRFLKEDFLPEESVMLNLTTLSAETVTASQVMEACETLPVFSDKRVVIVDDCDFTKEGISAYKNLYEGLHEYIQTLPRGLVLVMISPKEGLFKGRFVKQAEKNGELVSYQKLQEGELQQFIRSRAKKEGRTLTPGAQRLFIQRSEYLNKEENKNLYDIYHHLGSLFDAKDGPIEEADVEALLPAPFTETIFQLVDSVSRADASEALRIYHALRGDGQDVYGIFYMLVRQIRNLIRVKAYEQRPYAANGPQDLGIRPFEYNKLKGAVGRFSFSALFAMLRALYETESEMKESPADDDILVTVLLHRLCAQ